MVAVAIYDEKEIVEKFLDPLVVFDMQGQILSVNKALLNFFGYYFKDLAGTAVARLLTERDREKFAGIMERIISGKEIKDFDVSVITKDGREIPISFQGFPLHNKKEEIVGGFGVFIDIRQIRGLIESLNRAKSDLEDRVEERTAELQQKTNDLEGARRALMNILEEVEEARRDAEEEKNKTLAIIANFSDGLLVFDKENKLSLINYQAEKIFGAKAEEILGKHFLDLSRTPHLFSLISLFSGEIKELSRIELIIKENLIVEISMAEIKKDQEKIGFFIIAHDVTREKEIEKIKSEFVSISAHQLRTPLSAIKWTLRTILDGDAGQLNPDQIDLLQKTYISNERMIALVNDLLDVTRIEEGKRLFKPGLADIAPILQFAINSFKGESEKRQISVEFKSSLSKMPKIMLDVEKIKLAFQNIIGNAIRYTPTGGKVTITLGYGKKEVEISIKDTGIGIPQISQQKIFSKFFRSQNAVRMETEGSGLGLFIAKNIIEAHGGRIWFESEEGKGTTFYVAIPVKEEFEEFLKKF
ncbi:MAG: PAS domain S-box protein [Parcubacteria group bacterium]